MFLAIFFIGLNSFGITGNVISEKSKTSIVISPEVVSKGETVYVTVVPGTEGVNEKVSFYLAEDDLRKSSVSGLCNSYRCADSGSISFIIPQNWQPGVYYVKVYDYEINEFISEDFTVRN